VISRTVQYSRTKIDGPYEKTNAVSSVSCKIWLEKDGAVFGESLYNILMCINSSSSIAQAARKMGMSYRLVWGKIRAAENNWGIPLVLTQVGGEMGGGTSLTPQAKELLRKYHSIKHKFDQLNQEINNNSFWEISIVNATY